MLDPILMLARYVGGLRGFLQHPLPAEECRRIVETQLRNREQAFLAILERGVFGNPRSPYRKLLEHAGLGLAEVSRMLARLGVEGALEELLERGVHVGLEELKGRRPILRRGLELRVRPGDFDNPLLAPHYETRTGGSRGPRTRLVVDLDLLAYEAAQTQLFVSAFGAEDRPVGIWREVLPGPVGIKTFLRHAKIGGTVSKWFTPRKPLARAEDLKFHAFTMATALLSRWAGRPMPWPEHVPPAEAGRVAAWLAEQRRIGTPALLDANPSGGARVCIAAREQGLDISGTLFRFSAEPYTPAKAALVRERGCRAASHYAAGEVGYIGLACAQPELPDEVHLMTDKVALLQRQRSVGRSDVSVGALIVTTLLPSCPKLLLNVDLGDYATLTRRRCGCLLDRMGFATHLSDVRSWEKLTSAGVTFLGTELVALVEEVLPARFGGSPLDYQFVEEEEGGIPRVSLVVHPRLRGIHESEVLDAVLADLRGCPGGGLMADVWRDGETLRVVRREPYATGAFKLLPLHLLGRARGR